MKMIFFLPESTSNLERFHDLVELVNSAAEAIVTRTIEVLTHNLRQPKPDLAFVVLITSLIKSGSLRVNHILTFKS